MTEYFILFKILPWISKLYDVIEIVQQCVIVSARVVNVIYLNKIGLWQSDQLKEQDLGDRNNAMEGTSSVEAPGPRD